MKKPLAIYGSGGLGREIVSWVQALEQYEVIGFIDDHQPRGTTIAGHKVIGDVALLNSFTKKTSVIIAIGDPLMKAVVRKNILNSNVDFPSVVHPAAIILNQRDVVIGEGSIISAGAVLTTNITIGNFVLVNLNCTIGHDAVVKSYTSIMPGANIAGNVLVEEFVLIGAGANVKNNIRIGARCRVGMGAAVVRDVADSLTVVGVPAKPRGK